MSSSLRIIGLGYKIGVGKDTVAEVLCSEFGYTRMRFADALKEAVSVIFGWPRAKLENQEFKAKEDPFWGVTPRTILQRVGTEAMRQQIRDDIWIKSLELRIKKFQQGRVLPWIVIPDMRFLNEVEAIKAWGGKTVQIIRPDNEHTPKHTAQLKHASESELDGYTRWDDTIVNDEDVVSLILKVRTWHAKLYPTVGTVRLGESMLNV